MASAVLASQNESSWGHMGKIPYTNSHLNSNPNPKKKQKKFHHTAAENGVVPGGRHLNVNNVGSPVVTQTASDDAYSFNQTSTNSLAATGNYGGYVSLKITNKYSKTERRELQNRLSSELHRIKDLIDRIESSPIGDVGYSRSEGKPKKLPGNNKRAVPIGFGSGPIRQQNGHGNGSSVAVNYEALLKECGKILTKLMKHKHAYVFKTPVDAVALGLHDYHQIVKRPMDLGTVKASLGKNLYPTPLDFAADVRLIFNNALLYNPKTDPVSEMAEKMLSRFEELFRPMQEKLVISVSQHRESELEETPFESGEELQGSSWNNHITDPVRASPPRGKKVKPKVSPGSGPLSRVSKKPLEKTQQMSVQAHSSASTPSHPIPMPVNQQQLIQEQFQSSPVRATPMPPAKEPKVVGRPGGTMKQPKPRAKDLNKRDMSMEEKQKLGLGLQSLPQEKMPQLVQIIKKRNEHLAQDGDEIELDIEALDTETLWELDRFVTNWKKFVSKTKRQALLINNNPTSGVDAPSTPIMETDTGAMSDKNEDSLKKFKDNDDEDVDIDDDDDMPVTSFPPVEIEKDEGAGVGSGVGQDHDHDRDQDDNNGNAAASSSSSSSGSSSSDSSSTSDSDSGSSSGSDSGADEAQS